MRLGHPFLHELERGQRVSGREGYSAGEQHSQQAAHGGQAHEAPRVTIHRAHAAVPGGILVRNRLALRVVRQGERGGVRGCRERTTAAARTFSHTATAESRKATPQKRMKPGSVASPCSDSARKPVKAAK